MTKQAHSQKEQTMTTITKNNTIKTIMTHYIDGAFVHCLAGLLELARTGAARPIESAFKQNDPAFIEGIARKWSPYTD
jgi:hypothetical protein